MYANIDGFDGTLRIYAEDNDLCYLCVHTEICPLLSAIQFEAVILRYENIDIAKCGMFKEITLDQMIAL